MNEARCTTLVRIRAASCDSQLDEHHLCLPCESCGFYTRYLERHHRQFRSRGGLWVPSNVMLICNKCHVDATNEAPWIPGSGLNVHSYEEPTEVPVKLWHVGLVMLDDEGTFTPALPLDIA